MKKRSGIGRAVPLLSVAALDAMPTRGLLARLERLRFCEQTAVHSDLTAAEIAGCPGILFKASAEWRTAHADVKAVLARREHVPRRGRRSVR